MTAKNDPDTVDTAMKAAAGCSPEKQLGSGYEQRIKKLVDENEKYECALRIISGQGYMAVKYSTHQEVVDHADGLIDISRAALGPKDDQGQKIVDRFKIEAFELLERFDKARDSGMRNMEEALRERIADLEEALDKLLRLGEPWPLHEVLQVLANAANHLLDVHNCDVYGHELFRRSSIVATEIIKVIFSNL